MSKSDKYHVPGSRKGICTQCGKATPVDKAGNFRYCCSEECAKLRAITGAKNAAAVRKARLAKETAQCQRPECGATMPKRSVDGGIRKYCSTECAQKMYPVSLANRQQGRAVRRAGDLRVFTTQAGAERISRRICDTCADQPDRRPKTGCPECELPYGPDKPLEHSLRTVSALGDAPRWA